jgi:hypothetical protein
MSDLTILRELFGLFVEDASFALTILVCCRAFCCRWFQPPRGVASCRFTGRPSSWSGIVSVTACDARRKKKSHARRHR